MKKLGILLFLSFLMPQPQAAAKTFRNSYIQFSLPDKWDCYLQGKAYICRHKVAQSCKKNPKEPSCIKQIQASKEAIIVMAAKETSSVDSLKAYKQSFSESRKMKSSTGASTQSKVIHSKTVNVKKQPWVDTMQLHSELPYFYTRYLASIKGNVAVLVTFSAHKMYYTKYSSSFFNSIKSLEILTNNISRVSQKELGHKVFSRPIDLPSDLLAGDGAEIAPPKDDGFSTLLFILAAALALLGLFIWVKNSRR